MPTEVKTQVFAEGESVTAPTGPINFSESLNMTGTDTFFKPPTLTTTQRDALSSPQSGWTIFNSTNNRQEVYMSGSWEGLSTSSPGLNTDTHTVSSADYTVLDADGYRSILVTTGAANRTITLPTAADNTDRILDIIKVDSGAGDVIVDGEGVETINGSTTRTLSGQWDRISVLCDGTSWYELGDALAGDSFAGVLKSGVQKDNGDFAFDTDTLYVDESVDRVGIGTTAPDVDLHVKTSGVTDIRCEGVVTAGQECTTGNRDNSTGRFSIVGIRHENGAQTGFLRMSQNNGTNQNIWIDNSGDVRVSSTAGHIGTSGSGTVVGTQTSDERLKKGVVDYVAGVDHVLRLRPIKYIRGGRTEIGFGAQSTKEVIPEAVYETYNTVGDVSNTLAMDYARLIPALVNSVKELVSRIEELEQRQQPPENRKEPG